MLNFQWDIKNAFRQIFLPFKRFHETKFADSGFLFGFARIFVSHYSYCRQKFIENYAIQSLSLNHSPYNNNNNNTYWY